MSYFFKTFEEIGEYVDAIKGYRYVDNPSGASKIFLDAISTMTLSRRNDKAL